MSRYIDKEDLIQQIEPLLTFELLGAINAMQTKDVVMCKDCRFHDDIPCCTATPDYYKCKYYKNISTMKTDFCSKAMKKVIT